MDHKNFITWLKNKAPWDQIKNFRGSAHSSMIGFMSASWINGNEESRFILDGPPRVKKDSRRCADIILCESKEVTIVVEIETTIQNYANKIENLQNYLSNDTDFPDLKFGVLFMLNYPSYYQHIWDNPRQKKNWNNVENMVKEFLKTVKRPIVLVSFTKEDNPIPLKERKYERLLERIQNSYFNYQFNEIVCKSFVPGSANPGRESIWP